MYIIEFKTDLVSDEFEIDLAYSRNQASRRGGLEMIPSPADYQEQAEAV